MEKNWLIHILDQKDLRLALDLVWRTFLEFEAPGFSKEGIQEFQEYIEYDVISEKLRSHEMKMWGCIDQNNIVGVLAARNKTHISLLFVDKSYHRQKIATGMLKKMIEELKITSNDKEITVNSSPYAVSIYHKLGFIDTGTEQSVDGIRFTPMKLLINSEDI